MRLVYCAYVGLEREKCIPTRRKLYHFALYEMHVLLSFADLQTGGPPVCHPTRRCSWVLREILAAMPEAARAGSNVPVPHTLPEFTNSITN